MCKINYDDGRVQKSLNKFGKNAFKLNKLPNYVLLGGENLNLEFDTSFVKIG